MYPTHTNTPRFASPKSIVSHLQLWKGDHVADFGAGTGYFVLPLAESVGDKGKVYAVDIKKDHVRRAEKDAHMRGNTHVSALHCNLEENTATDLESCSLDAVLIANTFFHFNNQGAVLREAARVLRSGGKLCIIDTSKDFVSFPKRIGFTYHRELPEIACGAYHYGILFTKD